MFHRRRLALLAIPVLVATAITTLIASPAAASVPGREVVTRSTDSTSDSKPVSVSCTGDRWVLSSGVSVEGDGRRYVIVDELIPTVDTVTAHAYEFEYGTNLNWVLRVWAVCGDPIGSHRTSSRSTESNSDNKGRTVECPDDLVVSGLGWEIEGDPGQILIESAIPESNSVTVDAYEVDAGDSGEYFGAWTVTAYATCVTRPAGYEIIPAQSIDNSSEKPGAANCTGDKVALGGGFFAHGPRGRLNTTALVPGLTNAITYTHEVVATTNDWHAHSYGICASR